MNKIKFGTDGWRAIIADDFTVFNLERVSLATAEWILKENTTAPSVVIGYDCRFGGKMFAETASRVFCEKGIKVFLSTDFVSTPMVSLGTRELRSFAGIVITASHNPPEYNGFKIKASYGGPAVPSMIEAVESKIPDQVDLDLKSVKSYQNAGLLEYVDLETMYCDKVEQAFDLEAIRNNIEFGYDAMYGAGQNVIRRLFKNAVLLHSDFNPSFHGQAPEPIHKNLTEFSNLVKNSPELSCGLATDGDADRIGFYDDKGAFVDSHHLILLLIHYLCKYKELKGKVVITFSVSEKVKRLCEHYNLPYEITKIGFKYIAEKMITEDILLGGEESGGIAIKTHIPERDGIWIGLTIMEFMAKTGKSVEELIKEVYDIVGSFSFARNDLHISHEEKLKIIENCEKATYSSFNNYKIRKMESIDGFKFFLNENDWVMIRPSGTEPVLRVYSEAENMESAEDILKNTIETIKETK